MNGRLLSFLAMLVAGGVLYSAAEAADWPSFRGPTNTGVGDAVKAPAKWTADNFLWKIKLPGRGTSTPIICGDRVFVTCFTGYGITSKKPPSVASPDAPGEKGTAGKKDNNSKVVEFDPPKLQKVLELFGKGANITPGDLRILVDKFSKAGKFDAAAMQQLLELFGKGGVGNAAEQKDLRLIVCCFDARTGKPLWQREVEPKLPTASAEGFVREHGYASNTPVTDGKRLYVFFGHTGVLAFDLDGKQLWQADVGSKVHANGTASSLLLHKDMVIVNAGVESGALLALDKSTGKEIWRSKEIAVNWTSPVAVQTKDKTDEIVLAQTQKISGFDPATGKELWYYLSNANDPLMDIFDNYSTTFSTPVANDGVVYVTESGGLTGQSATLAIRCGGRGDISKTHVVWRQKGLTRFSSPMVSGDLVYYVDGYATCVRADTGKVVYKERLTETTQWPSPVMAGDKIFVPTRYDGLFVVTAGTKFEALALNEFQGDDSGFNASPALSNGRLFVRSNAYLYCIGNKSKP